MVEVKLKLPFIMVQTKSSPKFFMFESKKVSTKYQLPLYVIPVIVGAVGVYLLSLSIYALVVSSNARTMVASISPLSNLLIPGVNPYVPVLAGWIAIFVAVLTHELAHGLVAKINGINVNKMGILLFLCIPIGAFVEVDEAHLKASPKKSAVAVLSAGATTNVVIAIISLVLLTSLAANGIRPTAGYPIIGVEPNAPLSTAVSSVGVNITAGSMMTAVNNAAVNTSTFLDYHPGEHVTVTIASKTGTTVYPVTLGLWTSMGCDPINASTVSQKTLAIFNSTTAPIRSCVGITTYEPAYLATVATMYGHSLLNHTFLYMCVPDLPGCASVVPFSYVLAPFFTFKYNVELYQILFWLWFVNINLAIFNVLPIYGLDGGQVFREVLDSIFEGNNWDKKHTTPILILASLIFVLMIGLILALPYI